MRGFGLVFRLALILGVAVIMNGCVSTKDRLLDSDTSQVQLRSMQVRAFDTINRERMLRTVIATLQDLGFVLDAGELGLGTVTGTKYIDKSPMRKVQVPRYEGLEEEVLETFARMYAVFDEDVERIPPSRFCELRYEELVRDPIGQLSTIYDRLGLNEFDRALPALREYVARTADYKTNRYQISPETREQIATRWKGYIEKYGYGPRDTGG